MTPGRRLRVSAPRATSPDSYAASTAWVRSRSPSLPSTRLTWVLTVSSGTTNRWAISALDRPVAIRRSTSLVSLAHSPTLRAAAGTVIYLALIALLSLGIATAIRDATVAIGAVLALLYVFPILAHLVGGPHLQRHSSNSGR